MMLDVALERRAADGVPIRVAVSGAGFIGRAIAWRLLETSGIELVAVAARRPQAAEQALEDCGATGYESVDSAVALDRAISARRVCVTDDPTILGAAAGVDVVIEATSSVEFGATVAVAALEGGKHLVLVNADLDATLGPLLKTYADRAGVVVTGVGGEEHGVAMDLYRYVEVVGLQPVLAGNIKGFYDPYRNPETQRAFAEQVGQRPEMVASFADGTKLSMETTILANAIGFQVAQRGMVGMRCEHVRDVLGLFPAEDLLQQGLVEYTLGAEPGSGAFVVGHGDVTRWTAYMRHFKLGDGPLHLFYQSHHLPHLEAPLTVARAALFDDATVTPRGEPACEVVTCAKRDLRAGELLDGIGGFTCYGMIENAAASRTGDLLPIGLSEGCRLLVDVPRDAAISRGQVDVPRGRLIDALYEEQLGHFGAGEAGTARS
jgi:predicted homoserine dehydrogenase-like protein